MKLRLLAAIFVLFGFVNFVHAQSTPVVLLNGCGTASYSHNPPYFTVDTTGKLCVNATVSASVTGFTPNGNFATITSSGASGSVALPAGTTIAFQNTGTTTVSCTLGVGSATALANEIQIPASSTVFVTPGSNTFGACIDQTGSTSNTVVLAGGAGLGAGFGGGGGSGGGGAVTLASGAVASGAYSSGAFASGAYASGSIGSGAMVDLGTIADAAATAGSTGTLSAKMRLMTTQLATINNTLNAPMQNSGGSVTANAGTNLNTSALATSANQTNKTAFTQLTDGTNAATTYSNYGTAPSGLVPGFNAFVTNGTADPCASALKKNFAIGGAGGNIQIVGGSGSTKVYLCSLTIVGAAAAVVNIIEGTGAACTTANEAAVMGSTTAANGMSLAANGGLTLGNGLGTVGVTATAGNGLCILQSGTTALAGNATYVQQ